MSEARDALDEITQVVGALRAIAEAATPGSWGWVTDTNGEAVLVSIDMQQGVLLTDPDKLRAADAEFIEEFDPQIVLHLLDLLESNMKRRISYSTALDHVWDRLTGSERLDPLVTELVAYLSNIRTR